MNPLVLTSMAAASTSVGGCCAVLLQRRIHLLMAFGAGVLVGAAAFDLLPAAAAAGARSGAPGWLISPMAALGGLLVFAVASVAARRPAPGTGSRAGGRFSAALLVMHSMTDGTAIFAASTVSLQLGLLVGLGVVAHDVCDGLNTILLASGGRKAQAVDYGFLALDALAPIAGGLIAAHWFRVSPLFVMIVLSLAAGSFLYAAGVELFPGALVGAGPSAATPRVPLVLAPAWGPAAPSRRCASLPTRFGSAGRAGRPAVTTQGGRVAPNSTDGGGAHCDGRAPSEFRGLTPLPAWTTRAGRRFCSRSKRRDPLRWGRGPRHLLPWLGVAGFGLMFCLTRMLGLLG